MPAMFKLNAHGQFAKGSLIRDTAHANAMKIFFSMVFIRKPIDIWRIYFTHFSYSFQTKFRCKFVPMLKPRNCNALTPLEGKLHNLN